MSKDKIIKNIKQVVSLWTMIAVAVIIVELVTLSWLKSGITTKTTTIKNKKQVIQNEASLLDRYNYLLKEEEQADIFQPLLEATLADKDGLLSLSREFSAIANKTGVDVVPTFSGETDERPGYFDYSGMTVTIDGNYDNVIRFLTELDKSRFLLKMSDFNFTRLSDSEKFRFFARGLIVHRK